MAIKNLLIILIFILYFGCANNEKQMPKLNTIKDDLYKTIIIDKIPQKVISLSPNLTELLFELGQGNKIIGNTSYCNYPDSAKLIENVANLLTVNLEKIKALNPDLIFITTEGNSKTDYEKLSKLGLKVFVSNPRNYNGIKKTLLDMGKIFKSSEKVNSIVDSWDTRLNIVKKNHDKIVFKTAIFFVSTSPIFSIGKNSFIHQILTFSGLENISANSEISYHMYKSEEIIKKNPDYILLYENNTNDVNELVETYPEWNTLSAVVNNRVLFLSTDLFRRPGSRFVEAVEKLNMLITK